MTVDEGFKVIWRIGKGNGALRTGYEAASVEEPGIVLEWALAGNASNEVLDAAAWVAKEESNHRPIDDCWQSIETQIPITKNMMHQLHVAPWVLRLRLVTPTARVVSMISS